MNSRELLQAIIDSPTSHAIMFMGPDGVIQLWNSGAERIFGYGDEEIVGQPADVLFVPQDLEDGAPQTELDDALRTGCGGDFRWHVRKDGSTFWADGMIYPVRSRKGALMGFVKILRDATEQKRAEEQISKLALADVLTGLPNRAEFMTRLEEAAALSERNGHSFFVMLMDLDHFKSINDRLGHLGGDDLLKQAAARMRSVVRETDVVARLGGDEFAMLVSDADGGQVGSAIAEKVLAAMAEPFRTDGHEVRTGVSIGISVFPSDSTDIEQLLRNADAALYKAKSEGRHGYQYFTEIMDFRAHQRSREIQMLARVSPRHFHLMYQPVVDGAGNVLAIEALLRCSHPFFASYPVERLVGLAAETGRLRDIGIRSVTKACTQAAKWQREGWPQLHLVMNFCRVEIGAAGLAERIAKTVVKTGFPLECFEADFPEDQLHGGRRDEVTLQEIREAGLALTIDDFSGTQVGLTRLASTAARIKIDLKHFPGFPSDPGACAVLSATIQLAHALGLLVVVERVQTPAEADFIRDRCDAMQGFHVAEPMTGSDMGHWLAAHRTGLVA
ncbi:diguanylate cyclase domain-containing protein [Lysobacter niastensis]|uniref:Diguanylate cyclase n=1 Tax=Lysobacter niastensis TaxID=380629 RepID=A0ABS0B9Y1_9GAMM|nr:diguanylate cyclase [Lysobacter niastensis]MBF6024462.1 diguanylate cyclase [Lysobacter niastensis]